MKVSFNQPVRFQDHFDFLSQVSESSKISSGGEISQKCEEKINRQNGSENLLVPSATAALEMMAILMNIEPGDEVIVPSFTFVSTANAFVLRGACIRFADNDQFGNILPSEIDRLYSNKTKAVCVVHYGGNSADMDQISEICRSKNISLLEDAAQCADSKYKDRPLGTIGELGCYSFHDTKNITSGEGGSLIINDQDLVRRAEIIRDKGTNRKEFSRGLVNKYSWVDLGSSYCLSEINAAYLLPQLSRIDEVTWKRKHIWNAYQENLATKLADYGCSYIAPPQYNTPNYHMFALICESSGQREKLLAALSKAEVQAAFHYVPLHTSPYGKRFWSEDLVNCDSLSSRILRLPLWYNMTDDHIDHVISSTLKSLNEIN